MIGKMKLGIPKIRNGVLAPKWLEKEDCVDSNGIKLAPMAPKLMSMNQMNENLSL